MPIIITAQIEIPAGKTVELDLNGKTVTVVYQEGSDSKHIYALNNYGNLTIKGEGSIESRGIFVQDGSKLTVESGSLYGIDSNGGSALWQYGGDIVINGGHIEQKAEGTYNFAINALGGTVTVNGGWIGGNHGAIATEAAAVVINDGELVCTGTAGMTDNVLYTYGTGTIEINGGTFVADNDGPAGGCCVYDANGGATINGGTFGNSSGGDVWGTTGTTIKGGTFENLTEKQHIADGYEMNENGEVVDAVKEVKVATLAELQAALADNSSELPIIITETIVIPEGETVVLDLNGKTVTRQDETNKYAINNLGTLTIQDTKGNGSINARGIYNGYGNGGANVATAKITVLSGTINAKGTNGGAAIFNYGSADIQGGNFTSIGGYSLNCQSGASMTIADGITANNGIYVSGATLVVNGGEISGNRSGCHVLYAWNSDVTINGGTFHNYNSGNSTTMAGGTTKLTITGGTFTLNIVDASSSYLIDATSSATYTISGGSFTGGIRAQGGTKYEITGGTFTNEYGNYNVYEGGDINISGGTFTGSYAQKFATDNLVEGYELGEDGKVVSTTPTLPDYVVLPEESAFDDNTVTDGINYYATLQAAVEAVAGQKNAVLYCKPGADVGSLQHAPVVSTLTIYGNGANVTGGSERDFDLGNTDPSSGKDITADMTLTVKHLNGCGAWGAKATEHTVNLVFENCANMGKVFITGTTGTLNITMNDCAFEGVLKEAVYSNANGAITLNNVAFSNLNKAINLNHKVAGTQTVTINGCSFTNCGNDVAADQIPVRVLSSVEGGKSVLTVSNTTFTGTPEGGADILLDYGVGESALNITETAANVSVEIKEDVATTTTVSKSDEQQTFTNAAPVSGLTGEGSAASPYLIKTVEDLILFRNSVNAGETKYSDPDVYVALGADIDLAGENWVGIGSIAQPHGFMGNFDGKNFKIKNLTITNPVAESDGSVYAGLFSITEGTDQNNQNVIKNLTIENVTISTTGHIVSAAIAYPYYTIVDNVTVCGNISIKGGDYTAGALAYTRRCVNASNITVAGNAGSTITGAQVVGGVISDIQMNGGLKADYSNFSAEGVSITGTKMVGGISGIISEQTLAGASVSNVSLTSGDNRVGIVSGSLGGVSTITGVTYGNVEGATAIVGPTYKGANPVEAKIGDTYYATFEAAMAAEGTDNVELLVNKTITLDNDNAYTYTKGASDVDVKYSRNLIPGIWNPLYIPFDATVSAAQFEVADFTAAEGTTITLTKLEANEGGDIELSANTAYVVRPIDGNSTLSLDAWGYIYSNEEVSPLSLGEGFSVRGNYSVLKGENLGANDRVVNGKTGNWGVLKEESILKPFRLILSVPVDFTPEQSAAISMRVLDNTTGVEETIMDGQEAIVIFDLMGRRVETMTEGGIYIVNGKKIVF